MPASALPLHIDDHPDRGRPGHFWNGDRKESILSYLPKERTKTVVAALLLFASSLCTSFSLTFLNEVVPRDRPVPDLVFQLVPIQEWAWPMSDVLVVSMASFCGILILLHKYRWIIMRRVFLIAAVLYFLRALAMLVTWMPLSDRSMLNKCITPQSDRFYSTPAQSDRSEAPANDETTLRVPWSIIGLRMWQYGISLGFVGVESNRVLCGDYIYSGHTLMYVLTTLTLRTYMPRTGIFALLRYAYPLATIIGMAFVVISRLHYTIDVLVAYWMTTLTFWCYHLLIALPRSSIVRPRIVTSETTILISMESDDSESDRAFEDENRNEWRQSSRSWSRRDSYNFFGSRVILGYFEKNIPAGLVLPREFNWPFDGPKFLNSIVNSMNDK